MMSTLHFHYHHHGYGCLCNLPHSDALKLDDADMANQQLLLVKSKGECMCAFVYVCMCENEYKCVVEYVCMHISLAY